MLDFPTTESRFTVPPSFLQILSQQLLQEQLFYVAAKARAPQYEENFTMCNISDQYCNHDMTYLIPEQKAKQKIHEYIISISLPQLHLNKKLT